MQMKFLLKQVPESSIDDKWTMVKIMVLCHKADIWFHMVPLNHIDLMKNAFIQNCGGSQLLSFIFIYIFHFILSM